MTKAEALKKEEKSAPTMKPAGSLFGDAKKDASGSLFGATKNDTGGSLFGAPPAKSDA